MFSLTKKTFIELADDKFLSGVTATFALQEQKKTLWERFLYLLNVCNIFLVSMTDWIVFRGHKPAMIRTILVTALLFVIGK